jgi:alkaline phosphatase
MFDQKALDNALQEALANVPSDHTNVVLATADTTGAEFVVGMKRDWNGASWQVQGLYRHEWSTSEDTLGAKVLVSW